MDRELLLELKEFLTERMVDNMSTKDLEEYVANDLFNYFDKLGEHEFLEEARNYWDDSFDDVLEEVKDYMKCDFKKDIKSFTVETDQCDNYITVHYTIDFTVSSAIMVS